VNSKVGQTLLQIFDCIYVINLPSRLDRRRDMEEQMSRVGLTFDMPNVELVPAVRPSEKDEWPSIGARGCFMSHLEIIQKAQASRYNSVAIIEDDANWTPMLLAAKSAELIALSEIDWDFFYGGSPSLENSDSLIEPVRIPSDESIMTTHFVGLRGAAIACANSYLSAMAARQGGDPLGGPMHVDGAYNWFRRANPDIDSVICRPGIAYQRASRTDVHELGLIDRMPGLSALAALVRQQRNRLRSWLN